MTAAKGTELEGDSRDRGVPEALFGDIPPQGSGTKSCREGSQANPAGRTPLETGFRLMGELASLSAPCFYPRVKLAILETQVAYSRPDFQKIGQGKRD